jgi:hypothetical protein
MTGIKDVPDDVLARVIIPYCALKDRMRMVRTCKQTKRTIMKRKTMLHIDERVDPPIPMMLVSVPGLITNVRVRSLEQWQYIVSDEKQMNSIRILTIPYDVVNTHEGEWRWPKNIEKLIFVADRNDESEWFQNQVVGWSLPESLTSIDMGERFNKPVVGWILPSKIEAIDLGYAFNQYVEGWILPKSTIAIDLGVCFNQPVERWLLPSNVLFIILDSINLSLTGYFLKA